MEHVTLYTWSTMNHRASSVCIVYSSACAQHFACSLVSHRIMYSYFLSARDFVLSELLTITGPLGLTKPCVQPSNPDPRQDPRQDKVPGHPRASWAKGRVVCWSLQQDRLWRLIGSGTTLSLGLVLLLNLSRTLAGSTQKHFGSYQTFTTVDHIGPRS